MSYFSLINQKLVIAADFTSEFSAIARHLLIKRQCLNSNNSGNFHSITTITLIANGATNISLNNIGVYNNFFKTFRK